MLLKEYLEPRGFAQKQLADDLGISFQRVNEIIKGKRSISPEAAWLLSEALNTSPQLWLNLQALHDLSMHRPTRHVKVMKAVRL
jgi:antitoxin HigA-1